MSVRKITLLPASGLILLALLHPSLEAGEGIPPFGHWPYESGTGYGIVWQPWQPDHAFHGYLHYGPIAQDMDDSHAIPPELLAAADAIFQAGGYVQSAAAYARLNVRYGSSDLIFGRRFIAQVASGDMDQAAVVVASANAAGFRLNRADLPGGNLDELFSWDGQRLSAITERLASHALSATRDAEAMEMMGLWLKLAGDEERSGLFMRMSHRLSSGAIPEVLPTPNSKSELLFVE